jgi:phenyl-phosphate phosphatase/carboxylase subunit alpha
MPHYDLRDFLAALDSAGELRLHAGPIDTRLEMGALVQRIAEKGGPAVKFTGLAQGPSGASLVGATLNRGARSALAKLALALDLDPQIKHAALVEEVVKRLDAPVKPMQVRTGPCKENILRDADIDLERTAAPWIHGGDGGPCPTSWSATVVQEPGSNHVVWDVIPHLIGASRELTAPIAADSPIARVFARHQAAGTPMPFAIVLGGPPVVQLAAAFRRGRGGGASTDLAGSLQRSPLQLVKCETSSLMVPATAEMIIEGVVHPTRTAAPQAFPGPFGYATPGDAPSRVWEVTAITHRNEPILPFASWGVPVTEIQIARSLDCDTQLKQEFMRRGTPVRDVFTPPFLAGCVVAVSTKVPYTAFSQAIAGMIRTTEATKNVPYILVFDDDIDITNPVSLFHAMVTKCKPGRDTWQIHNSRASHQAPYLDIGARRVGRGASMIFDCTWPLDWDRSIAVPPRVSFDQCYPKELQERVLAAWSTDLGFPKESDRPAGAP